MNAVVVVASLHLYPIKACAGIAVPKAVVGPRGFAFDRRWMVVRDTGMFVTQRDVPQLCLVRTALDGGDIVLTYGETTLRVPLVLDNGDRTTVQVWRDRVEALAYEPSRELFSRVVEGPARLVYMPDDVLRPVNPKFAKEGDVVSFADGYPVLLASTSSLAEVERRVGEPMPMTRFRPNIVVAGAEPFSEDTWEAVDIGGVRFRSPKLCDRCTVTTVDPETGTRGKEPLRTLAEFRSWDDKVWFGTNLVPEGEGDISVGAPVEPATLRGRSAG